MQTVTTTRTDVRELTEINIPLDETIRVLKKVKDAIAKKEIHTSSVEAYIRRNNGSELKIRVENVLSDHWEITQLSER